MTERVVAFVDGSNLFGGIDEILKPGQYFKFSEFLTAIEKEIRIDCINFYGTYMQVDQKDTRKRKLLARTQKEFFDSTKDTKNLTFYQGHFSKTTGKEKGVDMHMGIDMVVGACVDTYDTAIIVTGDADLLYAVETTQKFKKTVVMVCLSSRFPWAIAFKANHRLVYDLNDHFQKTIRPSLGSKLQYLKVIDFHPLLKKVSDKRTRPPASGGHVG
ncbi:MAG: NYN domain-containing protein [Candidatus Berkelbacteria bacterium]|nr:NYN domain-containing protein [Candidatus Berkelbacteria bacterium]MCR4307426.1 NYN domain-containing protein [Candidatus Berkelbacteria bacterium]